MLPPRSIESPMPPNKSNTTSLTLSSYSSGSLNFEIDTSEEEEQDDKKDEDIVSSTNKFILTSKTVRFAAQEELIPDLDSSNQEEVSDLSTLWYSQNDIQRWECAMERDARGIFKTDNDTSVHVKNHDHAAQRVVWFRTLVEAFQEFEKAGIMDGTKTNTSSSTSSNNVGEDDSNKTSSSTSNCMPFLFSSTSSLATATATIPSSSSGSSSPSSNSNKTATASTKVAQRIFACQEALSHTIPTDPHLVGLERLLLAPALLGSDSHSSSSKLSSLHEKDAMYQEICSSHYRLTTFHAKISRDASRRDRLFAHLVALVQWQEENNAAVDDNNDMCASPVNHEYSSLWLPEYQQQQEQSELSCLLPYKPE